MKGAKSTGKNDMCINLNNTKLTSNCTVQLYSRLTGKPLQFITDELIIDANGSTSSDESNTHWNVQLIQNQGRDEFFVKVFMGDYQLAIIDGETEMVLKNVLEPSDKDILLKLGINNRFIHLESSDDSGHHVGVFKNGSLKPAIATGFEIGSQFYPKLISGVDENDQKVISKTARSASDTKLCTHDDIQEEGTSKKDTSRTLPRNVENFFSNEKRMSFAQMRNSFRKLVKK